MTTSVGSAGPRRRGVPLGVVRALGAALSLPVLALAACDTGTDAPGPEVVSAVLESPAPLVRRLTVTLARPAPVEVRYGSDGLDELRVVSPRALTHVLHLTRLAAGRAYAYEVIGADAAGAFETEPLPADLAEVRFESEGWPTPPLALLHLFHPEGFKGYAAVDGAGNVMWYRRTVGFPFGMTRRRDGDFVFMDGGRGLVQVTPWGEEVASLAQDPDGREMHHDVVAAPDDRLLFIAFDTRPGEGGAPLKGDAVWAWDPERGEVARRWSSWDHMTPERDRGARFGEEWLHANALHAAPDGELLVSLHFLNQVVAVGPGGDFSWRLGGPGSTWELAEADRFSGQHTARRLGEDRIVLFDNQLEQGGPSRVLELDVSGATARRVWAWTPPNGNFATAVGSARRLDGGNTLVGFGMSPGLAGSTGPIEVYEVDPAGAAVWHLRVTGPTVMYRAEPLEAVLAEEVVPGS